MTVGTSDYRLPTPLCCGGAARNLRGLAWRENWASLLKSTQCHGTDWANPLKSTHGHGTKLAAVIVKSIGCWAYPHTPIAPRREPPQPLSCFVRSERWVNSS